MGNNLTHRLCSLFASLTYFILLVYLFLYCMLTYKSLFAFLSNEVDFVEVHSTLPLLQYVDYSYGWWLGVVRGKIAWNLWLPHNQFYALVAYPHGCSILLWGCLLHCQLAQHICRKTAELILIVEKKNHLNVKSHFFMSNNQIMHYKGKSNYANVLDNTLLSIGCVNYSAFSER